MPKSNLSRRKLLERAMGAVALGSAFKLVDRPANGQPIQAGGVNRNSAPSQLKITDMRAIRIASNYDYPIIRIDTNQGVYGLGEVRDAGNEGMARIYDGQVDSVGDYVTGDRDGSLILDNVERQTIPLGIGVISQNPDLSNNAGQFRRQVYRHLIQGGKGIAWYRDGNGSDNANPDVTTLPMWSEVPKIKSEIDQMLPLLRQKHWTAWRATGDNPSILIGTRDYNGRGHLILQNWEGTDQTVVIALDGLTATTAVDYFSGTGAASITGGQLVLTLPAYGSKVLRLE